MRKRVFMSMFLSGLMVVGLVFPASAYQDTEQAQEVAVEVYDENIVEESQGLIDEALLTDQFTDEAEIEEEEIVEEVVSDELLITEAFAEASSPVITTQPEDISAHDGDRVTLSLSAQNASSYQWKYSKDGTTWSNCTQTYYPGCKTNTIEFDALAKRNGWMFKCVVTGNGGTIDSDIVTLTIIDDSLKILTQPEDISANDGDRVTLSLTAQNASSYQWKYSKDGTTWSNCTQTYYPGCKTNIVEFDALAKRNGWKFKCIVTGKGETIESDTITLTIIDDSVKILTQPEDISAYDGDRVTLSLIAQNASSYQWKYSKDGTTWSNCTQTYYPGCKTNTIEFDALAKRDGWKFKCIVIGSGETLESDVVTLSIIDDSVKILTQPEDISAHDGDRVTLSLSAQNASSYQWKYSKDGTTWSNCTQTYYPGCKTDTVGFDALAKRDGWQFKCIVTGNGETLESDAVTLSIIDDSVKILVQPEDISANDGDRVTLSLTAQNAESYQWKYSKNGTTWSNCTQTYYPGCKTDTVEFDALLKRDGWQFKCVVTGNGETIESDIVSLSVSSPYIVIDDVSYEAITESTCRVYSYAGSSSTLTIPESVEGMTVVEIGAEAFMNNNNLVSIDLPDTIERICERAFKNCSSLSVMD